MIYLAANNSGCWRLREQGFPVGWMMSPAGLRRPTRDGSRMPWALDNGLYRPFGSPPAPEAERLRIYGSLARAVADAWPLPMFAVVPDVPFEGDKSRAVSAWHRQRLRELFPSVPLAVAVQDGMTEGDLDGYDWVFIAGSTDWKLRTAAGWVDAARVRGMKAHMARVNSRERLRIARVAGCESVDGTGIWRGDRKQKRGVLEESIQELLFAA